MTFTIDTGAAPAATFYSTVDMIRDSLPDNASQDDVDSALAATICADIATPKRLDTARKALCYNWPIIAPLAERYPERFDQIIAAYCERMNE